MKMLYCIYLLVLLGNNCNNKMISTDINKIIYYDHGNQNEINLSNTDIQNITKLLSELTAGYENNVQLMMTDNRREKILNNGKCLEIYFNPETMVKSNQGSEMKVNKVLLFLEGEFSSPSNQESCLFLLADNRGYLGNVFNSPYGNKVIKQLRSLLKI